MGLYLRDEPNLPSINQTMGKPYVVGPTITGPHIIFNEIKMVRPMNHNLLPLIHYWDPIRRHATDAHHH